MSTPNQTSFQIPKSRTANQPVRRNEPLRPCRVSSNHIQRRTSPNRVPPQENHSLMYAKVNHSLANPGVIPRGINASDCRDIRRNRQGTSFVEINEQNPPKAEILSLEKKQAACITPMMLTQFTREAPSMNQSFGKENQARCQAPLRTRTGKGNNNGEPKSAVVGTPSSSTGKLIERSRQKVAEKHASRIYTTLEKEAALDKQASLMSMIQLNTTSFCKDPKVIREYMNKHRKPTEAYRPKRDGIPHGSEKL